MSTLPSRKNQRNLTQDEQTAFINGIAKLINNGTYGELVVVHSDMQHNMHADPNDASGVAQQRFLPWHRAYLINLEHMLQQYQPGIMIPYWDWTIDQSIPQWIQDFTPTIQLPMERNRMETIQVRRIGGTNALPSPPDVAATLQLQDYTSFATALENIHDQVHGWFSPTTLSNIMIAPADPLFFMHHANVDRIWSIWQQNAIQNNVPIQNQNPNLSGDDQVMDPFPYKEANTRSIQAMGYTYL